jgi:hypothetical protein
MKDKKNYMSIDAFSEALKIDINRFTEELEAELHARRNTPSTKKEHVVC